MKTFKKFDQSFKQGFILQLDYLTINSQFSVIECKQKKKYGWNSGHNNNNFVSLWTCHISQSYVVTNCKLGLFWLNLNFFCNMTHFLTTLLVITVIKMRNMSKNLIWFSLFFKHDKLSFKCNFISKSLTSAGNQHSSNWIFNVLILSHMLEKNIFHAKAKKINEFYDENTGDIQKDICQCRHLSRMKSLTLTTRRTVFSYYWYLLWHFWQPPTETTKDQSCSGFAIFIFTVFALSGSFATVPYSNWNDQCSHCRQWAI